MRFRHILRRLVQMPMFTIVAAATLAIGIGANAAIFAVIDGVLLKPLPFTDSDRLVAVDHSAPGVGIKNSGAAPFLYFTYHDQARTLQGVGLWRGSTDTVTGLAEPEEVRSLDVTYDVLPLLGVEPAVGRLFSSTDDSPSGAETVMLLHGYWQTRFGGDPSVVGRRLMVNGRPRDIIGVLPATFHFLDLKPRSSCRCASIEAGRSSGSSATRLSRVSGLASRSPRRTPTSAA